MTEVWAAVIAGLVAILVSALGILVEGGRIRRQAVAEARRLAEQAAENVRARQDALAAELAVQHERLNGELRLQEERLRAELRTEYMAEAAIHQLLVKSQAKRSFESIEARLGGFDPDELRRLLVRAGAVRFKSKDGAELWGLRDRNEP